MCHRNTEGELIADLSLHKFEIDRLKQKVIDKENELQSFIELFNAARMVAIDLMYQANKSMNIDDMIIARRNRMKEQSELPTI